jgi:DNA repair exonuclease SbcCD nuclease subunit
MKFVINGHSITCLGDPHLGRRFTHNVPLHRRGDREAMVETVFREHFETLDNPDYHVCMGDLFDRPVVAPADLMIVLDTYAQAIERNPRTRFIILAGNHDLGRDLEAVSSFDIVATWAALLPEGKVRVVKDKPLYENKMLFCPWHPSISSKEMVDGYHGPGVDAAFGHWDVVNPKSDFNMVPSIPFCPLYITGHDHHQRALQGDDRTTYVIGSMQPYAHGEDDGEMYRTVSLSELLDIPDTRQLCLRVVLKPGEELPDGLDALQIESWTEAEFEEDVDMRVALDGFDMTALFDKTMTKHGVSQELTSKLFERYRSG